MPDRGGVAGARSRDSWGGDGQGASGPVDGAMVPGHKAQLVEDSGSACLCQVFLFPLWAGLWALEVGPVCSVWLVGVWVILGS